MNNKTSDYLRIEPILTTNGRLACLCQNMEKFGLDPHSFFWYQQIVSAQDMWIKNQPSSEKMRSSILGCMTGPMGQMESTSLFEITSDNEINFPDLLKEPSSIYLQSSVRAPQLNGFLTLFINRFYNYVFDQDRQTQKPGDHRRVHFVIDELPLLNRIPNLSGKLASGLGSQLLFDLAIQDIDQLQNRYGSEASSILANCSNTMFIAGDGKTIDYLESRSAGLITKKELSYKGDNTVYLFRSLVTQKMLGRNQSSLPICCKTMPFYFMIANIQPFSLPRKVEKKGVPSFESIEEYNKKMHMLEVKKGKRALTEELESTDVNIKCVIDTVKKGRKTNPIYDDPIDHGLPMAQGKLSLFDFVQPIGDDGDYVIRPDCKPLISEALNNMNCDIHKLKRRDSVITMYGSVMATYLSDKNEWDISDDMVKILVGDFAYFDILPVEFDDALGVAVDKLKSIDEDGDAEDDEVEDADEDKVEDDEVEDDYYKSQLEFADSIIRSDIYMMQENPQFRVSIAQGKLSFTDFVQPIGDDGDYVIRPEYKRFISEALNNTNCDIHKLKRRDSVITMYGSVMATYLSDKNEWDISDDLVKLLLCYYATGLVPVEFDNAMAATVGKLQN